MHVLSRKPTAINVMAFFDLVNYPILNVLVLYVWFTIFPMCYVTLIHLNDIYDNNDYTFFSMINDCYAYKFIAKICQYSLFFARQ